MHTLGLWFSAIGTQSDFPNILRIDHRSNFTTQQIEL